MTAALYTPGRRLGELVQTRGDTVALIVARADGSEEHLTYAELDAWSNRLARRLAEAGVGRGGFVVIHLPNCTEHVVATLAVYKVGGCPTPLAAKLPVPERDRLLALAKPAAIVSDAPDLDGIRCKEIRKLERYSDAALPDLVPEPIKAIASGGSTGQPKLIVTPGAFNSPLAHPFVQLLRFREDDLLFSPGPLYHNQAFFFSQLMLFAGGRILLNERFDAERALELTHEHRPQVLSIVPTMMQRMLRVPRWLDSDLSSVRLLWHMASPCPEWVKRGWIERLGAERVYELWGATENVGIAMLSGPEWLQRPGSVGKGFHTEFLILGPDDRVLPAGEIGEVYSRLMQAPANYAYRGSEPAKSDCAGFTSVGDLGYLDTDGYLYLVDRRVDMIITGGANVYPAEVESALSEHPGVRDVVVIGVRDDDLGRRVHAIVECANSKARPRRDELDRIARNRLAAYKVPRSYEFLERLPRDEAGKIRRLALRDARDALCAP